MVSFRGQKKVWATPISVSSRGFIQNLQRKSPLLSYAEYPPEPTLFITEPYSDAEI